MFQLYGRGSLVDLLSARTCAFEEGFGDVVLVDFGPGREGLFQMGVEDREGAP